MIYSGQLGTAFSTPYILALAYQFSDCIQIQTKVLEHFMLYERVQFGMAYI